jgi:hypothetical protein
MADYELTKHEETMLRKACRTADSLDVLQTLLQDEGLTSETPQGRRIPPALAELRQQRIATLHISTGEDTGRTQRRGTRGVYGIRGVS